MRLVIYYICGYRPFNFFLFDETTCKSVPIVNSSVFNFAFINHNCLLSEYDEAYLGLTVDIPFHLDVSNSFLPVTTAPLQVGVSANLVDLDG